MSKMQDVMAWCRRRWWWLIGVPLLPVACRWLWTAARRAFGLGKLPPRSSGPVAGPVHLSSDEAQKERVRIKTEMDKRRQASGQKVSGWLERIKRAKDKLLPVALLVTCAGVQGCTHVQAPDLAPMGLREAASACESLVDKCEQGEAPACESAEMCARLYGLASGAIINLDECQQNCRVTTGEQAYHLSACRALAERLRADRWVYGGVGLLLGIALTAGAALSL